MKLIRYRIPCLIMYFIIYGSIFFTTTTYNLTNWFDILFWYISMIIMIIETVNITVNIIINLENKKI